MKKNYAAPVAAVWLMLALLFWVLPKQEISDSERRKLQSFPRLTWQTVENGRFMSQFETWLQDQFPLRERFRQLKSVYQYGLLRQLDKDGVYILGGQAGALEYPLKEELIQRAGDRFTDIYAKYLTGSTNITLAVIPDKSCYLAAENGYPSMDYDALYQLIQQPWANFVDLRSCLSADDYYSTDIHWRQEKLQQAAAAVATSLGNPVPDLTKYRVTAVEKPFYGVYYGQAALPFKAETMYLLESDLLDNCMVVNRENSTTSGIYDLGKLESRDLYDVYLGGPVSLLEIENPAGEPGKELVVFRDSFGSSLVPLILDSYSKITMIDIRYISSDNLQTHVDFHGQDVLFLYSTTVLNRSTILK